MNATPPTILEGTLQAPPARVFRAWTTSADIAQWWHPNDADVVPGSMEADPREDGVLTLVLREADTHDVRRLVGRYIALDEPHFVEVEYGYGTERHRITASMEPHEVGTHLTIALRFDASDDVAPHLARGWSEALRALGRLVASHADDA
jgi:uncharacterized protein YndB with AHSA1/START domain